MSGCDRLRARWCGNGEEFFPTVCAGYYRGPQALYDRCGGYICEIRGRAAVDSLGETVLDYKAFRTRMKTKTKETSHDRRDS